MNEDNSETMINENEDDSKTPHVHLPAPNSLPIGTKIILSSKGTMTSVGLLNCRGDFEVSFIASGQEVVFETRLNEVSPSSVIIGWSASILPAQKDSPASSDASVSSDEENSPVPLETKSTKPTTSKRIQAALEVVSIYSKRPLTELTFQLFARSTDDDKNTSAWEASIHSGKENKIYASSTEVEIEEVMENFLRKVIEIGLKESLALHDRLESLRDYLKGICQNKLDLHQSHRELVHKLSLLTLDYP